MDHFDRERYIKVYNLLAEIMEREDSVDSEEHQLPHALGDLARRIFVGSGFLPPDEILEESGRTLRSPDRQLAQSMARRLREHAQHLTDLEQQ